MEPIVNEITKEVLPASFITSFVSEGWDRIGVLKDQVTSLSDTFSGTEKVVGVLQDLLDAYLVCVGQMEGILHSTDAIASPEVPPVVADIKVGETPAGATETPVEVPAEEPETVAVETPVEEPVKVEEPAKPAKFVVDSDFFVDFDDPDMSEPALTDEDIYPDVEDKIKKN